MQHVVGPPNQLDFSSTASSNAAAEFLFLRAVSRLRGGWDAGMPASLAVFPLGSSLMVPSGFIEHHLAEGCRRHPIECAFDGLFDAKSLLVLVHIVSRGDSALEHILAAGRVQVDISIQV